MIRNPATQTPIANCWDDLGKSVGRMARQRRRDDRRGVDPLEHRYRLEVPSEGFGLGENKYRVTYSSEYVSAVNSWKWTQANYPEHGCKTSSDELEGEFADVGTLDFVLETDWAYAQR